MGLETLSEQVKSFFIKIMHVYAKIKFDHSYKFKSVIESKSYPIQERTDFHMQYLRLDDNGLWTSKNTGGKLAMQILISPASYDDSQTNLLLEGGIKNIEDDTIDIALSSAAQFETFEKKSELTTNINTTIADNYVLLWKKGTTNSDIIKNIDILKNRINDMNESCQSRM